MNKHELETTQGIKEVSSFVENKGKNTKRRTAKITIASIKEYNSETVKNLRKELNLTQKDFAILLGVSTRTIESWEMGINKPSGSSNRLLELFDKNKEIACLFITKK